MKKDYWSLSLLCCTFFNCIPLSIGNIRPNPRPATPSLIAHVDSLQQPMKEYNLYVNMAADNDLYPFAGRSIRQLQTRGSDEHINILIQLDIHLKGQNKVTKRFYVERNRLIQVGKDLQVDTGDPKALTDFFKWGYENFPARHHCLDFWNHGTGFIDPIIPRTVNPSELFYFNTATKKIELDRRIGFIDFVTSMVEKPDAEKQPIKRGICFAESTGTYLTNRKMRDALHEITKLLGRKLDIIFFDACLMQMWEIFRIISDYSDYSVGSQEVELGPGYNYTFVLEPFADHVPTPYEFACHAVNSYERAYSRITNDYTQSAVRLKDTAQLDKEVNNLATLLIEGLQKQRSGSVKEMLRTCRNKRFCTQFDEPSYIDLHCLLANIQKNCEQIHLRTEQETKSFKQQIKRSAEGAMRIIDKMVIANKAGSNLPCKGISIYFPERRIHPSCYAVPGVETNKWLGFVGAYLGT